MTTESGKEQAGMWVPRGLLKEIRRVMELITGKQIREHGFSIYLADEVDKLLSAAPQKAAPSGVESLDIPHFRRTGEVRYDPPLSAATVEAPLTRGDFAKLDSLFEATTGGEWTTHYMKSPDGHALAWFGGHYIDTDAPKVNGSRYKDSRADADFCATIHNVYKKLRDMAVAHLERSGG